MSTAPELAPPGDDPRARLSAANPAEKAEIVLRVVAQSLEGPPDLSGFDLRGAKLRKAVLRGVDLRQSLLREALLGEADLRMAQLDQADLREADLAGADLRGASFGKADCEGTLLEEANLRDASMRFVILRDAALDKADLRQADLWGADLRGASLVGADLRGAQLKESDLREADFAGVNFEGATLSKADLRGASLKDASLTGVVLSTCDLAHVRLDGAWLERTRLDIDQLGGAIGEEVAGEYAGAASGYLALERNFIGLGDAESASWAYGKRRRMRKRESLRLARSAWKDGPTRAAIGPAIQYLSDQFVEWLCGYGESISRVLASLLAVYVTFTILYGLTSSVAVEVEGPTGGMVKRVTSHPVDLAIFSLLTMTTGGFGPRLEPNHELALFLVAVHVFLGVTLIGLLGFVTGNRIRR